jgi:hypothetical protein
MVVSSDPTKGAFPRFTQAMCCWAWGTVLEIKMIVDR